MSNLIPFSQELAQQLYESAEQFPVDFEDGWQWLEYSRNDNAKANFLKCGFVEGVDYVSLKIQENSEGRPSETFRLTCECFKQWGMMAGTPKGKQVRMYFLDCERRAKEKAQPTRLQLTLPEAFEAIDKFKGIIELAKSSGNVRLMQQAETAIAQYLDAYIMLQPTLPASNAPRYEGCVDVAIRLGFKVPGNYESALGRYLGKYIPHLRISIDSEELKDYRTSASSGKRLAAFMYPAFDTDVEKYVTEYCQSRQFSQN